MKYLVNSVWENNYFYLFEIDYIFLFTWLVAIVCEGSRYVLYKDPSLTSVLDEVFSSLVPLCHKRSASVSLIKHILTPQPKRGR